jgi:hypothetical protein
MNCDQKPSKSWGTATAGAGIALLAMMALAGLHSRQIFGQQLQGIGGPHDWTHRHLIFSQPGSFAEAVKNGSFLQWYRTVTDPRFTLQQWLRAPHGPSRPRPLESNLLQRDWTVSLNNNGIVAGLADPAKFSFNTTSPSCYSGSGAGKGQVGGDFVVFPIDAAGASGTQANLIGVSNLYPTGSSGTGLCGSTGPTVEFSYYVGTGAAETSPVLSLNGAAVAFIETIAGGSKIHSLTLGTTGTNGVAASTPVAPCTVNGTVNCATNNAVDSNLVLNGGVNVTYSSVWVVYDSTSSATGCLASTGCVAYVGDDTGKLHKFVHVFSGTMAECTSTNTTSPCPSPDPWPITVASGSMLTGPVFDLGSDNIFMGGANGVLYYVREVGSSQGACASGSPPCLGSTSVTVGSAANPIYDAPVVDSTTGKVFAAANNGTNAVLAQANTALTAGSVVQVTMGASGNIMLDGSFDNAYFTSVSTGHIYFCGNNASQYPTLYRVGFNASGTMNATNDGNTLVLTSATADCTQSTEFYDTGQSVDWLFFDVTNNSTTGCSNKPCLMSFALPTASPFTFPTAAFAGFTTGASGISGIVVDNSSNNTTGSSSANIYYEDIANLTGVKVTQYDLE